MCLARHSIFHFHRTGRKWVGGLGYIPCFADESAGIWRSIQKIVIQKYMRKLKQKILNTEYKKLLLHHNSNKIDILCNGLRSDSRIAWTWDASCAPAAPGDQERNESFQKWHNLQRCCDGHYSCSGCSGRKCCYSWWKPEPNYLRNRHGDVAGVAKGNTRCEKCFSNWIHWANIFTQRAQRKLNRIILSWSGYAHDTHK